jgi:hypothetical protein
MRSAHVLTDTPLTCHASIEALNEPRVSYASSHANMARLGGPHKSPGPFALRPRPLDSYRPWQESTICFGGP